MVIYFFLHAQKLQLSIQTNFILLCYNLKKNTEMESAYLESRIFFANFFEQHRKNLPIHLRIFLHLECMSFGLKPLACLHLYLDLIFNLLRSSFLKTIWLLKVGVYKICENLLFYPQFVSRLIFNSLYKENLLSFFQLSYD